MRCGRFDSLVDRWIDGRLGAADAAAMAAHGRSCPRCAAALEASRAVAARLAGAPVVRAPRGFADAVMEAVAREALKGDADAEVARAAAPGYRRLGLSVLFGAAALTASFFLPREVPGAAGVAAAHSGGAVVKQALDGADAAVRQALGSAEGRSR